MDISKGADLFLQEASSINSLWAVYVVATFAGASYGVSSRAPSRTALIGVTVGFLAFAWGHLSLVRQALAVSAVLGQDLERAANAGDAGGFAASIHSLARTANPPWISITIHLVIDTCVVLALWSKPLVAVTRRPRSPGG
jgi:hypothetical protein